MKLAVRIRSCFRPLAGELAAITCSVLVASCGFTPARADFASVGGLSVKAAPPRGPDFGAVQAAMEGARSELSRWGLGAERAYPRLVIEVLRVEEIAAGNALYGSETSLAARGVEVAITARAWVEDAPSAAPTRETGDLVRSAQLAVAPGMAADLLRHEGAVRQAAHALGRDLARSALDLPVAGGAP